MTQVARSQKKFMVIIRPGFKKICADDACRAGMFNHILFNIAKQKQGGSDYWFSTGDAIWEETDRAWGKSKTLKEIKELETMGLLIRTRNPRNSWDQTKYYAFGEEQAKALHDFCVKCEVCLVSMRLPSAVTHLLDLTNAFCKNKQCICCNQQIDSPDLTNPFVETEIFPGDEVALQAGSETPYKDSYQDSNSGLITQRDNGETFVDSETPVSAIAPTHTLDETSKNSYSQENQQTTQLEQNTENTVVGVGAGYMQANNVNSFSQERKSRSKDKNQQAEQQGLPFQVDLGPLVMPSEETKWCPETAVTISEVLRNRRYTPKQREKQIAIAKSRIFARNGEFYGTSRVDFTRAFKARNDAWWINTNGPLTLEDLCAKGRLQKMIEKLGPVTATHAESNPTTSKVDTFAHVPAFGGKTEEQIEAEFEENLAALRAAGIAV